VEKKAKSYSLLEQNVKTSKLRLQKKMIKRLD
jgi:hypothetical protein